MPSWRIPHYPRATWSLTWFLHQISDPIPTNWDDPLPANNSAACHLAISHQLESIWPWFTMNRVVRLPRVHIGDLTIAMTFVIVHHHHLTPLDVRSKTQERIESLEVGGRWIEDHTFLGFPVNYVGIQVFPGRIRPRPRYEIHHCDLLYQPVQLGDNQR